MRQKFLLTAINAKYIHSNLAVYSLRAAAAEKGIPVEIAEFTINHYVEDILQELYRQRPDVLFFSCYIWNWEYVKELAAECQKIMPGIPIWVGGPEVSYDAEAVLLNHPAITGVLLGEGEESFPRLLKAYLHFWEGGEKEPELEDIEGIAFHRGEEIRLCPQVHLPDLERIPFPYEDNLEPHKIFYYESGRGCPFSCSYCLSSIPCRMTESVCQSGDSLGEHEAGGGKRVRFRSLDKVKRELDFFLAAGVPQVKFVDRTFNCRESHALEIWNYLLEHDNGVTNFHFEIAADLMTDAELSVIKRMRPGLIQLETGVQSTNLQTLKEIRRTMDFQKVECQVRRIKGFGNIHQHLDLIAGLPYENLESFMQSFNEVFALWPEQLQLGFLKVLKGSLMHERAAEYGILYREKAPYEVLSSSWMSYGELVRLKKVEQMVEVYYNSCQFAMTLRELIPCFSSPFAFFDELAGFYGKNGWDRIQHARVRRYEILLEFIYEKIKNMPERFAELLTFDYYLRENAKSRPSFAESLLPYREEIRRIQEKYGRDKHVETRYFQGDRKIGLQFWVFDYGKRSPLTKEAKIFPVNTSEL